MSERYTRRITLWINGKEVKNDIASITSEMTKLTNQQRRMTIGSKEYIAAGKEINQLKGILAQHRADLNKTSQGWLNLGKAAEGFNRYFGMVTAAIASFTGVALGVKKAIDSFNEFEERVSNLSALTGLAGDELKWLADKAKELSTSTLEGGIIITKSAQDIVDAFTKMGSARPELLKNKEALAQVTEQALILSEAGKIEMATAIDAVASAMNQFNLDASETGRIINTLAAGSLEGSAEIADLTESLKNVGTVASSSGMSLEQTVAALEVLAEKQLKGAESGTKLRGALLKMKDAGVGYASGTFVLGDAITEINEKLAGMGSELDRDALRAKIFGIENVTAGTILLQNVGTYNKLTAAVTGTNIAIEQAIVNTDNNNARLSQAKNRILLVSMELGEKLAPAYGAIISKSTLLLKVVSAIVDIFSNYGRIIIGSIAAIASYTVAVKLLWLWESRRNSATGIGLVLSKAKVFWDTAIHASTILAAAAQALFTGNITKATAAMRLFGMVTKSNPIGLLVTVLVAAGAALWQLSKNTDKVTASQKALTDIEIEAQKNLVEQKLKVQDLISIAADEKQSLENRKAALQELNNISPKYFGTLDLQSVKTNAAKMATDGYTESLLTNARVQAAQNKLIELEQQRIEDLITGADSKTGALQKIWNFIKSGGNAAAYSANEAATGVKNATKETEEYLEIQKKLTEYIIKNREKLNNVPIPSVVDTPISRIPTGTPGKSTTPFGSEAMEPEAPLEIPAWYEQQAQAEALRLAEKQASEEEWTAFLKQQVDERVAAYEKEIEIEKEIAEARQEIKDIMLDGIGQLAGALAGMFEQGSAAQIAMIAIEKAVAIAQIWINYAREASAINATAALMGPFGIPYAAAMKGKALASAGVNTALVVAQTVATAVSMKSRNKKEAYAEGKYPLTTGMHGDKPHMALFNEVPGQPEMVVDGITTRKLQLNYPEIIRAIYTVRDGRTPQYAEGKYPAKDSFGASEIGYMGSYMFNNDLRQNEVIAKLAQAVDKLMEFKPAVSVELFEKKQMQFQQIKDDNKL